ncbi:mitochondrial carrier domain-containing protein [Phlyctochytrium arcticum]|nr:mitochondrial carrier domain-containing protein [Phlyctochytrium arcticum]
MLKESSSFPTLTPEPPSSPTPTEGNTPRHELVKVIACGGVAGSLADSLMHAVDTVKTRMQRDGTTGLAQKYNGTIQAMRHIHRKEGVRGLFGGFGSAAVGSILATTIYFTTYEKCKRELIDHGVSESVAYFMAGALGDSIASIVYVPSEVVKTRMQLQGRYNNPYSVSPHNYKGDLHALSSIWKRSGPRGLYYGWRATLARDVPYTACQFTIYEIARARILKHFGKDSLTIWHDIIPGALAGTLAGFITTPLDVIKTYLQTQSRSKPRLPFVDNATPPPPVPPLPSSSAKLAPYYTGITPAIRGIYAQRGVRGLFSGAVPRMVWTGSQSTIMFLCYEWLLAFDWKS